MDKIINEVPEGYDSIFYVSVHTGEALILANLMPELLKKYNCIKPYFLFRNEQVADIFKIFFTDNMNMKKFMLRNDSKFRNVYKYSYVYKGRKIYIFFPKKHYYNQDIKILNDKRNETHFYDYICQKLGVRKVLENKTFEEKLSNKAELRSLIKDTGIGKKFVIFAPDARTAFTYNKEFYYELEDKLNAKGIDVIWNTNKIMETERNIKTIILPYEKFLTLCKLSLGGVGVRSGLFYVISSFKNIPKFILYTDFPFKEKNSGQYYTAGKAIVGFSLKKMLNADVEMINEYDTDKISGNEMCGDILKFLK